MNRQQLATTSFVRSTSFLFLLFSFCLPLPLHMIDFCQKEKQRRKKMSERVHGPKSLNATCVQSQQPFSNIIYQNNFENRFLFVIWSWFHCNQLCVTLHAFHVPYLYSLASLSTKLYMLLWQYFLPLLFLLSWQ